MVLDRAIFRDFAGLDENRIGYNLETERRTIHLVKLDNFSTECASIVQANLRHSNNTQMQILQDIRVGKCSRHRRLCNHCASRLTHDHDIQREYYQAGLDVNGATIVPANAHSDQETQG